MKYRGISTTDPTSGVVTIDGDIITPNLNDMVAFGNKEFIYRYNSGDTEPHWYELGDEDSPNWEEEEENT